MDFCAKIKLRMMKLLDTVATGITMVRQTKKENEFKKRLESPP